MWSKKCDQFLVIKLGYLKTTSYYNTSGLLHVNYT